MYDSPDTMGTTLITPIKEDVLSLDRIESSINKLTTRKTKDIEGYQAEILKMGRFILIPYLHKPLNLVLPIFKNGDKSVLSNYKAIMVSHILAKLYGLILEKKLSLWLESQ